MAPPGLGSRRALSLEHPSALSTRETPPHISRPRPGITFSMDSSAPPSSHPCTSFIARSRLGRRILSLGPAALSVHWSLLSGSIHGVWPLFLHQIPGGKTNPVVLVYFRKTPITKVVLFPEATGPGSQVAVWELTPTIWNLSPGSACGVDGEAVL